MRRPCDIMGLMVILTTAMALCACGDEEPITAYSAPKDQPAPDSPPPPRPVADRGQQTPVDGGRPGQSSRLEWTLPDGWTELGPKPMREATFRITAPPPRAAEPVEMAVTRFPGDVGGMVGNVNRWLGMVGLPPVENAEQAAAYITTVEGSPLGASIVDMTGPAGQDDQGNPAPATRQVVIIVDHGGHLWFFKVLDAADKVGPHMDAIRAFAATIRPAKAVDPHVAMREFGWVDFAAGPIKALVPPHWQVVDEEGLGRVATVIIGDPNAHHAKLAITQFPTMGNELANVNRWRRQVGLPAISTMASQELAQDMTIGGLPGRFYAFDAPGEDPDRERMLVASVDFLERSWFFKITGHVHAVDRPVTMEFIQFLKVVQFHGE